MMTSFGNRHDTNKNRYDKKGNRTMAARLIKEIKKDISAISKMSDSRGRLGFAISEAANSDRYDYIGKDVLSVVKKYPNNLDIIESTVIAVCGYGFDSLREKMKEQREHYETL